MATIPVTCPEGHDSEITDPNTGEHVLLGVVDGKEIVGEHTVDTTVVQCPTCETHFEVTL